MGFILRHFLRLTSPEMPSVFKDSGTRKGAKGGAGVNYTRPCHRGSRAFSESGLPVNSALQACGIA